MVLCTTSPQWLGQLVELRKQCMHLCGGRLLREDRDLRKAELTQRAETLAQMDDNDKQAKILKRLIRAEELHNVYKYLQFLRGANHSHS